MAQSNLLLCIQISASSSLSLIITLLNVPLIVDLAAVVGSGSLAGRLSLGAMTGWPCAGVSASAVCVRNGAGRIAEAGVSLDEVGDAVVSDGADGVEREFIQTNTAMAVRNVPVAIRGNLLRPFGGRSLDDGETAFALLVPSLPCRSDAFGKSRTALLALGGIPALSAASREETDRAFDWSLGLVSALPRSTLTPSSVDLARVVFPASCLSIGAFAVGETARETFLFSRG